MQIAIIDLGLGNLRSVEQAVHAVAPAANAFITHNPQQVLNADKVILPGQGAIGSWFKELQRRQLDVALNTALTEKPLLGICVGMQALFRYCEEDGGIDGLGVFNGEVKHFKHFHGSIDGGAAARPKIPQMGWNQVAQRQEHALWHGIADNAHFYFLHSYCANLDATANPDVIAGVADYHHQFVAAAAEKNVFATQFHPEKSHADGLQLIRNFCQWRG